MTAIPPPDDAAHEDNVLMAAIANVNNQLGRYVLRFLDTDAGRTEPMSPFDEHALADSVNAIAEGLHARATRRQRHGEPPALACATPHTTLTDDA
jgi:hypothetical protein